MCTVTIVPYRDGSGFRIGCNRDESNNRPAAQSPRLRRFGDRSAILPIDPVSDGTWIAVNDAGLAMVLLNRNPPSAMNRRPATYPSRGTIIPALLHCGDLQHAKRLACAFVTNSIAPFRLILVAEREVADISVVHSKPLVVERNHVDFPLMFTSSGLGDDVVEGPRRRLFREWFRTEDDWLKQQDRLHRHSWPDQKHISVCMRRDDARTVSFTAIDLRTDSATMSHLPQAPDERGPSVSLSLALQPMVTS